MILRSGTQARAELAIGGAVMYQVTGEELAGVTGHCFEGREQRRAHAQVYDAKARLALREWASQFVARDAISIGLEQT